MGWIETRNRIANELAAKDGIKFNSSAEFQQYKLMNDKRIRSNMAKEAIDSLNKHDFLKHERAGFMKDVDSWDK